MQSSHLSAVTARTGNAERAAIHNFDKIWSRLVPDNRLRPWGLAKFMTELRKSDDINAPPATFHDSMTLLRFWHYAQHELDKLEINKDRFREWWINEVRTSFFLFYRFSQNLTNLIFSSLTFTLFF